MATGKVPVTPVDKGKPVALVKVPLEGVPRAGVTKVGLLANTKAPEPVSSLTAEAKLADEGVPKNVATPVPKPLTPVEIGNPVAFVKVPEAGVPNAGVTKVGLFDSKNDLIEKVLKIPPGGVEGEVLDRDLGAGLSKIKECLVEGDATGILIVGAEASAVRAQ